MTAVLVIENDPGVSFFFADALADGLSAQVRCASTAMLGIELIETGVYDLAIIAVNMPTISGFDLARRAADRNIPTLLSSGNLGSLTTMVEFGIPHIAKPIRLATLISEAAKVIAHAQENIRTVKTTCVKALAAKEIRESGLARSRALMEERRAILLRVIALDKATT
jgi:DNA-binding response OmpR family regulator